MTCIPDPPAPDEATRARFDAMNRTAKRSQAFGSGVILAAAITIAGATSAVSAWNAHTLKTLTDGQRALVQECRK